MLGARGGNNIMHSVSVVAYVPLNTPVPFHRTLLNKNCATYRTTIRAISVCVCAGSVNVLTSFPVGKRIGGVFQASEPRGGNKLSVEFPGLRA